VLTEKNSFSCLYFIYIKYKKTNSMNNDKALHNQKKTKSVYDL
jgi:hypothetical protein